MSRGYLFTVLEYLADEFFSAVAEVAMTFGDSSCRPKLLASSATGLFLPAVRLSPNNVAILPRISGQRERAILPERQLRFGCGPAAFPAKSVCRIVVGPRRVLQG